MKIGVMFGSPETTTGGNALKYYSSVRLDVRRIGAVKSGDQHVGNRTRVKVVKNKLAPPFQKAEFDIRYGTGIDNVGDLLDKAVEAGAVEKSGAYYRFGGETLGQGREKTRLALQADDALLSKIRAAMGGSSATSGTAKKTSAAGGAGKSKATRNPAKKAA